MPHVFLLFENHPCTKRAYSELAKFIKDVTSGKTIESRMEVVNGKGIREEQPLDLERFPIMFSKSQVLFNGALNNSSLSHVWKKL